MKVHRLLLLGGVFVLGFALSGGALSLCDYVSPTTSISRMPLSFNYTYVYDGVADEVVVNAGRIRLDYNTLFDSPDFGYTVNARGQLSLTGLEVTAGLVRSTGTLRYYFGEDMPLFAFGSLSMSAVSIPLDPELDVTAGMGYGRFTDVTPLAKAMRIDRLLVARGATPQPLPDGTLMDMASMIGRLDEYPGVEELVAELVTMLEEEAEANVDPRSVLYVEDIVVETGDNRYCGWAVQAGLSYTLLDPDDGPQDLKLAASASMALPPTPGSQLLFEASLTGPMNIVEHHTLDLSASYEFVGDPLSAGVDFLLTRRQRPELDPQVSASATFAVSFPVRRATVGIDLQLTKPAAADQLSAEFSVSATLRLL